MEQKSEVRIQESEYRRQEYRSNLAAGNKDSRIKCMRIVRTRSCRGGGNPLFYSELLNS
jgi:hypothetical protein